MCFLSVDYHFGTEGVLYMHLEHVSAKLFKYIMLKVVLKVKTAIKPLSPSILVILPQVKNRLTYTTRF